MDIIIGYTGFVGSNLVKSKQFDFKFNSSNIEQSYGLNPDLLVYAGVKGTKFIANEYPYQDLLNIYNAINNIQKINPKKLILISSVDVYDNLTATGESIPINPNILNTYGLHRYFLEEWVKENYKEKEYLIVRLPAIYGLNLKKNFVFDMIFGIPAMIKSDNFIHIRQKFPTLDNYYTPINNNYYQLNKRSSSDWNTLKKIMQRVGITAINFTDSRAVYQFYNLKNLWKDIDLALKNNISTLNMVTPPVSAGEVYRYIEGKEFKNQFASPPILYNLKTEYSSLYGQDNGYICNKKTELEQLKNFVYQQRSAL